MKRLGKGLLRILKLRYQISIKGIPQFNKNYNYLLLPNHSAYIDPILVWTLLCDKIQLRPVATSNFAKTIILTSLLKSIDTIFVDDGNKTNIKDTGESIHSVISGLKNGESILLYPSGQIMGQGKEYIGGKKSAYLAVKNIPDTTKIYTLRMNGLRGSMWSNAWNGQAPSIIWGIIKGIRFLIANFFFFMPKREVVIEFEEQTEYLKQESKKGVEVFNQALEEFYNKNGEEKVKYIPHYFYYNDVKNKKLPKVIRNSIKSFQTVKTYDTKQFPQQTIEVCINIIKKVKNLNNTNEITLDSNLILELYLDSLDMAEIKNEILTQYPKASNTPILELKTVADLIAMALGINNDEDSDFKNCEWNISPALAKDRNRDIDENLNILQHFKKQRKNNKKASQLYDTMLGLQTRKDIVLKSILVSDYIKKIPGKNIGIMLPALGSTTLVLLATYLAKKVPVMMNWTHSESGFEHCVKFSKTKKILTSRTFLNKLNIPRLNKYEFIFIEDLLKNISLFRKLKAYFKSFTFPLPKNIDEIAVVLYTSGSEALPKAVPLTHKNLISDLKNSLGIMHIAKDERLFCYLPPFHSFGFSVNTIFPLITGLRSINTPDPNDSLTVAKLIAHTKPTILATTPTFLRNLLNIAKAEQLSSLRYVITGGEKCSEQVFKKFRTILPNALILEGYGITECSPIIAINPIEKQKAQSVGISIANSEIKILNIENESETAPHQEGMIYFRGENVFKGYLDKSIESPFLEKDGEIWYRTGDLGYLDKDGYLYITGRKKRFLKLGGEMISLPFLETLLQEEYGDSEEINLALEGKEIENGIEITLFLVDKKLTIKEVNSFLRSKGVSNLIQIDHIKEIGAIPLLGTGKVDYKILKEMIK